MARKTRNLITDARHISQPLAATAQGQGNQKRQNFCEKLKTIKNLLNPQSWYVDECKRLPLCEKCSYSEIFWSVFNPNAAKYGPEKHRLRALFVKFNHCISILPMLSKVYKKITYLQLLDSIEKSFITTPVNLFSIAVTLQLKFCWNSEIIFREPETVACRYYTIKVFLNIFRNSQGSACAGTSC